MVTGAAQAGYAGDVLDSEDTIKFIQENPCLVLRCSVEGTP